MGAARALLAGPGFLCRKVPVIRRGVLSAAGLGVLLGLAACTEPTGSNPPTKLFEQSQPWGPPGTWTLVWSDEFNGTRLDTTKWKTRFPYNRGVVDEELQSYSRQAVTVANGVLRLTATANPSAGQPYRSGMIASWGSFSMLHGVVQARIWAPAGQGYWPAFWTMNLPYDTWPPEIDMFEFKGGSPSTIWMGNHYGVWPADSSWNSVWTGPNFTAGWHTVTVVWTPSALTWYVDGIQRAATSAHIPTRPMYLVATLAVGGIFGGNPTPATVFPGSLRFDYIRVWK